MSIARFIGIRPDANTAEDVAESVHRFTDSTRYIFVDGSILVIGVSGKATAYDSDSSGVCDEHQHFYDDGYCEFCGIHEDEA